MTNKWQFKKKKKKKKKREKTYVRIRRMATCMSLWMCDDIIFEGGFPIKGSKSFTEITSWAFYVTVLASSQKEAIEILLEALALEPP